MFNKKIIQIGIIFFLLFPFIVLLFKLSGPSNFDYEELYWALKNTCIQASLSATLSLLAGFALTIGLLTYANFSKYRSFIDIFFLLPNFIPNLFIVVGLMNLIDPFPIGLIGIIIAHVFINMGVVAIYLRDIIQIKLGQSGELAMVLGAGRFRFIKEILIPQIKQDLLELFFYIFSICFSSFAIPMIIGGGRGTNLEILIYEKIRISFDWASALWIALFQSALLFVLSMGSFKYRRHQTPAYFNYKIISSKYILYLFALVYFFFFASFLKGVFEGSYFINDFYLFKNEIISGILGTFTLSLFVGVIILLFLLVLSLVWTKGFFSKFLLGYIAPSSALTALAFILIGGNEGAIIYLKVSFALVILYSSLAYRFGWNSILHDIEMEKEKAKIFGASEVLIYKKIVLPMVIRKAFFISGLCGFWASGEFAVSKIIGQSDFTLAMITETFISQYRLGLASILTVVLLFIGIMIFYIFNGVGSVISKKIENSI